MGSQLLWEHERGGERRRGHSQRPVSWPGTVVSWGFYPSGAAMVPSDLANVIQIASGGDHDAALFGARAPGITLHPFSRTVNFGSNTVLRAKAAGVQPVTYQWRFQGADFP